MKTFAIAVMCALTLSSVAACGASEYCSEVQNNTEVLNAFGQQRTNKAYDEYAAALTSIAKVAPKDVAADWTKLATVTEGVLDAQSTVGLDLADMGDRSKTADLDSDQLELVNDAYAAFNATTRQRDAVVKSVKQQCEITLQ